MREIEIEVEGEIEEIEGNTEVEEGFEEKIEGGIVMEKGTWERDVGDNCKEGEGMRIVVEVVDNNCNYKVFVVGVVPPVVTCWMTSLINFSHAILALYISPSHARSSRFLGLSLHPSLDLCISPSLSLPHNQRIDPPLCHVIPSLCLPLSFFLHFKFSPCLYFTLSVSLFLLLYFYFNLSVSFFLSLSVSNSHSRALASSLRFSFFLSHYFTLSFLPLLATAPVYWWS